MFPHSTDITLDGETKSSSGTKSYIFDFTTGDFIVRDGKLEVCSFTLPDDGNYTIKVNRKSGDHEIRLYDSDFKPMTDSYFYERSLELTAGSVFYISVTHYYSADASESTLQIFKEE